MSALDQTIAGRGAAPSGYTRQATFVFILGMHRSGTSCLAGSLERCGLFLGDVSRSNVSNPRGTHELSEVRRAHGQILRANGGSWRHPPAEITVDARQKRVLRRIATSFSGYEPCGIKDPRFLLLLEHWLAIVDSFTLVGTFRHPIAAARSLHARAPRSPFPEEEAYQLWLRYNGELVRWHKVYQFPIIEFDLSDAETYLRSVATLALEMGLRPDMDRLREFVSSTLDHHSDLKDPVPDVCQEMYAYLRQHSYQPDVSDAAFSARWAKYQRKADVRKPASRKRRWKPLRLLRLQSRLPGAVRPLLRPLVRLVRRLTGY
jgi:hypothetical protein